MNRSPDHLQQKAVDEAAYEYEQSHCADCGEEALGYLHRCHECGRLICEDCLDNSFGRNVCKSCGRKIDTDNCPDCNPDHEGPDLRRCLEHEKDECQRVVDAKQKRIKEIERTLGVSATTLKELERILGGQDASRHF